MSLGLETNPSTTLPLDKLLKGVVSLRTIHIAGSATRAKKIAFDSQTCALVLAIQINHVTATASLIQFYNDLATADPSFQATIASATGSGSFDGFSASTVEAHAGWCPIFLPPKASIYVTSDVTATFTVYIMEWRA